MLTESYKETEGLPIPIRRAKAFEKIVTEIPIYIDDDQLLMGDFAANPMGVEMHPDLNLEPIEEVIKGGIEGSESVYNIRGEDIPLLKEIYDYWKIWNIKESFLRLLGEEEVKKLNERGKRGAWVHELILVICSVSQKQDGLKCRLESRYLMQGQSTQRPEKWR